MEFAFLDESGDSGADGTNYLVLTLLCTSRKKDLIKIIRDTKKELLGNNKCSRWLNRNGGEIKFHNFPDKDILKRALKKISKLNMNIYFCAFEKNGAKIPPEYKRSILGHLFIHIHEKCGGENPEKIIADIDFFNDKKVNRFLLQNYKKYRVSSRDGLESKDNEDKQDEVTFLELRDESYEEIKDDKSKKIISIEHYNSKLSEELQALDLISGSLFQKFEHGNESYYGILESKTSLIEGTILIKQKEGCYNTPPTR